MEQDSWTQNEGFLWSKFKWSTFCTFLQVCFPLFSHFWCSILGNKVDGESRRFQISRMSVEKKTSSWGAPGMSEHERAAKSVGCSFLWTHPPHTSYLLGHTTWSIASCTRLKTSVTSHLSYSHPKYLQPFCTCANWWSNTVTARWAKWAYRPFRCMSPIFLWSNVLTFCVSLFARVGAARDRETWCKPVKLPQRASVAPQVPNLWSYHVPTAICGAFGGWTINLVTLKSFTWQV